ncbi:SoxH - like protein [Thioalkalivibrio nitratireducens DSM 14787]|uniref:SoxH-like protein n=1 Tax=Thioalkalivibrio nitratireducens (strain DSM 14787 / UNIQEM 213 / ALEN2) TaxID=1255043 RepID=L0DSN8_THIND|nr:MBL fold metallo-hydrolase [Thioalkalivibrio nitratireducens]AGA32629.1 SoxH - like protein [Thioalkalivibrio nitratireducens DSM 14787]
MHRSLFTLFFSSALALLAFSTATVQADTDRSIDEILKPLQLTDRVYYFYGSIEGRSPLNQGMNNNVGFVVTDTGVVMLDSGPSAKVAERIAQAVAGVTEQPITHVINLGSQDHRWLGNGWFRDQGAEIVALHRTVQTQPEFGQSHLQRLIRTLGEEAMAGTEPVSAAEPVDADEHRLEVGGVTFDLLFVANAHFPGDIMVHLPDEDVVFTGDFVYTERIMGIQPNSDPVGKLENFRKLEELNPAIVVPGHGAATDLATARRDAGDYLEVIIREVRTGLENWETLDETVDRLADLPEFQHLLHYDNWHRTNVNRTYLFLEAE